MKKISPLKIYKLKKWMLSLVFFALTISTYAQTENFEGEVVGGTTFTINAVMFNMTGDFRIAQFDNFSCGGTNSGANAYMDTGYLTDGGSSGIFGSIAPVDASNTFGLNTGTNAQWGWTGTDDGENDVNGSIRFIGTKMDQSTISEIISFAPSNTIALVPFTFSNSIWGGQELIKLEMEIVNSPACNYFALDELIFVDVSACATTASFTAPANLCIDAGNQTGLGGGTPAGGAYSGPGVTDNGNGSTYSFNPAVAGVGVHAITYTFNEGMGCPDVQANGSVEVFALPTVTFTTPADLCADAPAQNGLGSGSPTGGVYSGPGVTDDGNGSTYSFNPAVAGVGLHSITYNFTNANGCSGSAIDNIEISSLPTVTFTAPVDLCADAPAQNGLGSGSPTGGVYSGPGVTDDGNGSTYSFNPAVAGVGLHSITYDFTNANGCSGSATDNLEVLGLPAVTFVAPADQCIDAGIQAGQGGGTPSGGVYSGNGVTDDGNGMTFSFDPVVVGLGVHPITYTFTNANGCSENATDNIEIFAQPTVTFTALADLCLNTDVQTGIGGGAPTGGVYSGTGVTDDGNGMTYTFDPSVSGVGVHSISYTFSSGASCSGEANDVVEVFDLPIVTIDVADTIYVVDGMPPAGVAGGGTPVGGVYTDMFGEIDDDGNGETFSFNNAIEIGLNNFITYTYTDANGCSSSATEEIFVLDETVSIDDLEILQIDLFPNPTTGTIEIQGTIIDQIDLMDVNGKVLLTEKPGNNQLDISAFPNGIYFIKLSIENQIITKRIIKI